MSVDQVLTWWEIPSLFPQTTNYRVQGHFWGIEKHGWPDPDWDTEVVHQLPSGYFIMSSEEIGVPDGSGETLYIGPAVVIFSDVPWTYENVEYIEFNPGPRRLDERMGFRDRPARNWRSRLKLAETRLRKRGIKPISP